MREEYDFSKGIKNPFWNDSGWLSDEGWAF